MNKINSLIGQTFGYLTVVRRGANRLNSRSVFWDCLCCCGNETTTDAARLRAGSTKSCGCKKGVLTALKVTRHGHCTGGATSREYASWSSAIRRCHSENTPSFQRYGALGISVCLRWRNSFEDFLVDMGSRPVGASLDRYPDKGGNYSPENCRWATPKQQANNTKANLKLSVNEKELTIREACDSFGWPYQTVRNCIYRYGKYSSPCGLCAILI